jgi:hypothetical protein
LEESVGFVPVRLASSAYVVCREHLLDSFPESREIVALLLESCNSLRDPYVPTESGLVDDPDESDLLVGVAAQDRYVPA